MPAPRTERVRPALSVSRRRYTHRRCAPLSEVSSNFAWTFGHAFPATIRPHRRPSPRAADQDVREPLRSMHTALRLISFSWRANSPCRSRALSMVCSLARAGRLFRDGAMSSADLLAGAGGYQGRLLTQVDRGRNLPVPYQESAQQQPEHPLHTELL